MIIYNCNNKQKILIFILYTSIKILYTHEVLIKLIKLINFLPLLGFIQIHLNWL